jgi:hypothetical protein
MNYLLTSLYVGQNCIEMLDQPITKYIIKVGEIGYYKYSEKSNVHIVVRNLPNCTYFECRSKVAEVKTQLSLIPAIQKRGIELEIIKIEDNIPITT